jgi:hypothetical protein
MGAYPEMAIENLEKGLLKTARNSCMDMIGYV